jgi:CheY-like chemotaxis protein
MNWKILIADDDKDIIKLIKMWLLKKFDCKIYEVYNGEDALAFARVNQLNLIILDISMPKMNGEKVFLELRSDPFIKDIPILFCSALNDREYVRSLFTKINDNITDFLIKPIQVAMLYQKIQNLIEKASLLSEELTVDETGLCSSILPQIGTEYTMQIVKIEGIHQDDEYSISINDRMQKSRSLIEHKPMIRIPDNKDGTPIKITFKFLISRNRTIRFFYKII